MPMRLAAALSICILALCPPALDARQFELVSAIETEREAKVQGTRAEPSVEPEAAEAGQRLYASPIYTSEAEPNGTAGQATPLAGTVARGIGTIAPNADVDLWSFTAAAGDTVFAAVVTSSSTAVFDSKLQLLDTDGTTELELDDNDGSFAAGSSSLAGRALPSTGTYFLQVTAFSATLQIRPYELYLVVQSGVPTAEIEPNDVPSPATPLPPGGWVSGARGVASAAEVDFYSFSALAGETVFLSLDTDPERDNVQWNGRLGLALFGDAANQILVVDDASTGSVANPLSEAFVMTVKDAGTYYAFVDSASAAVGGPTATYTLSVTRFPANAGEGTNCTEYVSTDVPQPIGPDIGMASSTITVPGNPRIADIDVEIELNHNFMSDLDVHLRSPAGNDNALFTDVGSGTAGVQTMMDTVWDDEAAIPPAYTVMKGLTLKPEIASRLAFFDGEDAGGNWTLDLRDDNNADGGTLTGWKLRICEPVPQASCPPQTTLRRFWTDFEEGDEGFVVAGTPIVEWELGLPSLAAGAGVAAFVGCNSGVACWKTDLDGTYDISSSHDLTSPPIDLSALSPPVTVSWAHRFQMESATFDRYWVDIQLAGGGSPLRVYEWIDGTMVSSVGNPGVSIGQSAGWGVVSRRADSFAGQIVELTFHVDSDSTVVYGGVAMDDPEITACDGGPTIFVNGFEPGDDEWSATVP